MAINLLDWILPQLEHVTFLGYWVVLLAALLESLVVAGIFIPGTIIVIIVGFAAARGYLDVGDAIWFAAIGGILGDAISYHLGKRGTNIFRSGSRIFKLSRLEQGKRFLKKHGSTSVFWGRFTGPISSVSPFVAGVFNMDRKRFYFWNVISAFAWAIVYVSLGYFFGQAWQIIATWSTRIGIFILSIFILIVLLYALRWLIVCKGKQFFDFIYSLSRSIKQAVVSNSDVHKFVIKHNRLFSFLRARLTQERFSGLPLTLLVIAFVYTTILFLGLVEDLLTTDLIIAVDTRLANLLYVFRSPELIPAFLWITALGKVVPVIIFAIIATCVLWLWSKRNYILSLWLTLTGSLLTTFIGKLSLHRARPEGLVPVYVEQSYSFPSGHATVAVAFYGFLIYAVWRNTKKWKYRINLVFAGLVIIVAIGFSRLYLGVHFLSDVLSGYLVGLLWLIIGVSIIEWQEWRVRARKLIAQIIPSRNRAIITFSLGITSLLFYGWYALSYHPQLLNTTIEQQTTARNIELDNIIVVFEKNKLPKFTETLAGSPQEPLSFIIVAHSDDQLISAFTRAGWYRADQVSVESLTKITQAALSKSSYDTAPMTPSFWNSQVHDFGLEKPTDTETVNQRHHARFWKTSLRTYNGEVVYVGTASFDISIKWLVTHKIQPDIDTERNILLRDLQQADVVSGYQEQRFVSPTLGQNFSGDQFFTDGNVFIIEIK